MSNIVDKDLRFGVGVNNTCNYLSFLKILCFRTSVRGDNDYMREVIIIEGFNMKANDAVNRAIMLSDRMGNRCVNTLHLGAVLLKDNEVAKILASIFNIEEEEFNEFRKELTTTGLKENASKGDEYDSIKMGSTDFTDKLKYLIDDEIQKGMETNQEVTRFNLCAALFSNTDTIFFKVIEEYGLADHLDDMERLERTKEAFQFSMGAIDLNKLAIMGELDPVESRDDVIDQVIEVLGRRKKANPCLIGESGVGKTAIINGLAQRINEGRVPEYLKSTSIISLDIAAILAGCRYRGELEEKLLNIINRVIYSKNIILFFDEIHTLASSSGMEGGSNAMSIIKPALSRGDIKIIGATTTREYRKFIEKDVSFDKRIQTIVVEEPTVEEAIKMVNKVKVSYEEYHQVKISKEVVANTVKLSDTYITDKKLPDKAIVVIDETAAKIKAYSKRKSLRVNVRDIKNTISKITGIDVREMGKTDKDRLINLESKIKRRLIGQDEAVKEVSQAIRRNKSGVRKHVKPIGSFLFVGPTGVGKTELTKILADELFGGVKNMIRLDMSEYMEKHSVSRIIGSPPGYIGYDEGGQLTDLVKRKPYSIILIDEIEKAHPDVYNIFLQIMDDGILTDNRGETIDFKNTILIMTSNAGYGADSMGWSEVGFSNEVGELEESIGNRPEIEKAMKELERTFRLEFLNRLDKVVVFNKLSKTDINKIVKIMLDDTVSKLRSEGINVKFTAKLVEFICKEGFDDKFGARNISRKIQDTVENYLSDLYFKDELIPGNKIVLDINNGKIGHAIKVKELVY